MRRLILTLAIVALILLATVPTCTTAVAIRTASTPTSTASRCQDDAAPLMAVTPAPGLDAAAKLVPREPLQASGTLIQEPPLPSDWLNPYPREPTATTTTTPPPRNGVRPTDDRGPGRAPPPRNMDPVPGPYKPLKPMPWPFPGPTPTWWPGAEN